MKFKNVLYFITFFIFSFSAHAIELYGNQNDKLTIKTNMFIIKNKYNFINRNVKNILITNINFKGINNVNENLTMFGVLDVDLNINFILNKNINFLKSKLSFIGIKDKYYGFSIDYGKNYGVIYNVDKFTENSLIFKFNDKPTNFMLFKADNVLTYKNKNLFGLVKGLDIILQKQFENLENYNIPLFYSTRLSNGSGYGIFVNYKYNKNIDLAGAYSSSKRTNDQVYFDLYNEHENADAFSLGFKINTKKLYISSVYGQTYNITPYGNLLMYYSNNEEKSSKENDPSAYGFTNFTENIDILVQYKHKFNVIPSIGYFQHKAYGIRDINSHNLSKYIKLGFIYKLNEFTSTFIDYKINLLSYDFLCKNINISCKNDFNLGFSYNL